MNADAVLLLDRIAWDRVIFHLRWHGAISTCEAARQIGCHVGTLQNIANGRARAPRVLAHRLALLDLHYDHCREWHTVERLT